jgi:hypothetical protein
MIIGTQKPELLEEIETFWTVQQKQILAYHGINMSDVHSVAGLGCDGEGYQGYPKLSKISNWWIISSRMNMTIWG